MQEFISHNLNRIAFALTALVVGLLPVFFVPGAGMPLDLAKHSFVQIGVIVAGLLVLVSILRSGAVTIPKSGVLLSGLGVVAAFVIAGILSPVPSASFLGFGGELGTVLAIGIFMILLTISALLATPERTFKLFGAFVVGVAVLALFHLIRLIFGAEALSFGEFTSSADTILGKWNDLALISGLMVTLALLFWEGSFGSKLIRGVLVTLGVVSLFFLSLVNFQTAWVLVGVFSLLVFVYQLSFGKRVDTPETAEYSTEEPASTPSASQRFPVAPLIVAVIALLFLLPNNFLSQALSDTFGIAHIEVRPSWGATADITTSAISEDPFFGAGPNRFSEVWLANKPDGVNQTIFWNTNFNAGAGLIPSFVATSGIVGGLAWLIFLGWFMWLGVRHAFSTFRNRVVQYLSVASFLAALYLWAVSIFYVPHVALFALAFVWTGVFVGMLAREGKIKQFNLSFAGNPRVGFFSVFSIVVLLIGSIVLLNLFAQRTLAWSAFRSGVLVANNEGNLAAGETRVNRATQLYSHEAYYRTLSEIQRTRLQEILGQEEQNQDVLRERFQTTLSNTILSARQAVSENEGNYQNWVTLARVYEFLIPLEVEGAYANAQSAYQEALTRNPKGPSLHLALARLELSQDNVQGAREQIDAALSLKGNYTEAIFLLSQLEANEGNLSAAIERAEQAALLAPSEGAFFQLGFLRYQNENYTGALSALERAVSINPVYANAKYFLGLAYFQEGQVQDALVQFREVQELNPDNQEVQRIIENLEAGRAPFTDADVTPPDEREEPPIEE